MGKTAAPRKPANSTVRMGTALAIPTLLRGLGANPEEVLAEAGYDLRLFDDPENRISLAAHNHIVSHCAARTGCQHFGLLVGQQDGLHSFGLMGLLVKYSLDVGTALRSFSRYLHLHVRGATTSLVVDGGSAMFTYEIHAPGVEAVDQVGDGAVAVMHNIMRELCGPDWRPTEAWFAHRKPADVGPFRRFFRVPLRFDAEQFALLFSAGYLNRRLTVVDDELRGLLQRQIDLLENRYRDDFPEQVRGVLRTAVMTGHASADQVARLFSMHSRSLNRRLNAFGTSFHNLVDESRFEIARQMLEGSAMEVGQIAGLLDYAAPGVFTRAFRRWSGTTPARWRATRDRTAWQPEWDPAHANSQKERIMARKVTKSIGNVLLDLGFPPHEAEVMLLRAKLAETLRVWIEREKLTQAQAAKRLGIAQPRVSEITRGKVELLSLDYLVGLCAKAGIPVGLRLAA